VKELVVLSGKGGTGKTSVAAAFAHLAVEGWPPVRTVLADADVDAANLELVLAPRRLEAHEFVGGTIAVIAPEQCRGCGRCAEVCRFDAVRAPGANRLPERSGQPLEAYAVDASACEGCAACVYQCPESAIHLESRVTGHWYRSATKYGPLVHAALHPGQDNSGKLVSLVKQQARDMAEAEGYQAVIVDGPPGIGCPVIAAASGAALALIVTEPTSAGVHDLARVLATVAHFRIGAQVCVNKADVYPPGTAAVKAYCRDSGVEVVGQIPFDATVPEALTRGQPVTAYRPAAPTSRALAAIWRGVTAAIELGGEPGD
jgi:MinD superfamily P-loop ATPase